MLLWINGGFGIGKTTTASALCRRLPNAVLFDPELIGEALVPTFGESDPVRDFQDWPSWRAIVPSALLAVHDQWNGFVIAPQSVLVESYWDELTAPLQAVPTLNVMLDLDQRLLEQRIRKSHEAREWRLERAAEYDKARGWMRARSDLVIDAEQPTTVVVAQIIDALATA